MTDDEKKMLVEIHGGIKTLSTFVKQHQRDLHGNGRPGVIATANRNATLIKAMGFGFGAFAALATILVAAFK